MKFRPLGNTFLVNSGPPQWIGVLCPHHTTPGQKSSGPGHIHREPVASVVQGLCGVVYDGTFSGSFIYLKMIAKNENFQKRGKVPYLGPQTFFGPPLGPNFKVLGIIWCGYPKLLSQDAWHNVKGISSIWSPCPEKTSKMWSDFVVSKYPNIH